MRRMKLIKLIINRILGMKLRNRMICIYLVGGLLPMIFTCIYLMQGTSQILIQKAKDGEISELKTMKRQLLESINTAATVSRYFYFDEQLEQIAFNNYVEYQDIVDDYKEYTAFKEYRNYYKNIIHGISIYMENETISSNARFIKVDEDIANTSWYQSVKDTKGGVVYGIIEDATGMEEYFSLARFVRTEKRENVGVLVIYLREEMIHNIFSGRDAKTLLLINGKPLFNTTQGETDLLNKELENIPGKEGCKNITFEGEAYVLSKVDVELPESNDIIQIVSLNANKVILKQSDEQSKHSIVFMLFGVVLSVSLTMLFSRSFSNRVNRFRLQMQKAAAGDFELEEEIGGSDEISELYKHLGAMIYSIQHLLAQIYREQLQKEKIKTKQQEAQFKMLASQINPHFLYNTLETIRMKARNAGQTEIEELIKMLAKLLRRNIQAGSQAISLKYELELLSYYLKIQKYRFGDRIQYHLEWDSTLDDIKIIPFLIQPIAENAIIHGLECKEGVGNLWIKVFYTENLLKILIEDDGIGMSKEQLISIKENMNDFDNIDRTHIGISNVNERIKLSYGNQYGVTVFSKEDEGTRVEISMPMEEK